jgi:hypothetical protein
LYTKQIPFADFNGQSRKMTVYFNLTTIQAMKLFREFKIIIDWRNSIQGPERNLDPEEVMAFYSAFEEILLSAWGEPSEDGLHFRKGGRYDFEESALFNATMMMFLTDPKEAMTFVEECFPKDMEQLAKQADENTAKMLASSTDEELKAELVRLRRQLKQESPDA